MRKLLNVLCACLLCAAMGMVGCGDDAGGDDANNAVNNDTPNNDTPNNDTPNNDTPNNDTPNNDAPECGNDLCEEGENEANCPRDCVTDEFCEGVGDPCDETTQDSGNLTCLAGLDSTDPQSATCHQTCDAELDSADCPQGSFCAELNDGSAVCIRSNCTSPFNSADECAGVGENGGTCFEVENGALYCFAAGAGAKGSDCVEVEDCGPGLFCLQDVCQPLCENGDDALCDEGTQCLPALNSEDVGVCGQSCPGFNTTDECGEGAGCLPLTADLGLCQAAGDTAVGEGCEDPNECVPFSLCQTVSDSIPPSCRPMCNVTEGFGDETCPEGDICLGLNDATGVCFDGCTPQVDENENGCETDGIKTCLPIDDAARGLCLDSGTKAIGQDCDFVDGSVIGDCVGNAVCNPGGDPDADGGTCSPICLTFSSTHDYESGCADGEVCSIFGTAWGVCDDDVANPPLAPLEPCPTAGQWCSNDTLCLQVDQQGNNLCIGLCRPDRGNEDCAQDSECNTGFFDGDTFGLCLPRQ